MQKKINIVGAGVAGLCAGTYLQMNGYETEIFELHNLPGGLCTAWDRNGYRFDGCIHWLMGATPANSMYTFWNELIDMKKLEMVFADEYFVLEDKNGKRLTIYRNVDKLENELLSVAPEDKTEIKRFVKGIRKLTSLDFKSEKPPELMGFGDVMKMVVSLFPYIRQFLKWKKISLNDYSQRLKNPLLKEAVRNGFVPEMAALFLIMSLADMSRKGSAYPIGGSLNFAKLLEKSYLDLGGKIHYHAKVKKISYAREGSNAKATGVELENGQLYNADIVISAADGFDTLFNMLDGKFFTDKLRKYYDKEPVFSSYLQVSLGVKRTFDDVPSSIYFQLENPLKVDPETEKDTIGFRIFSFDPTLAQPGKTAIVSMVDTYNYEYWVNLRKNEPAVYKAEKRRIADAVIEVLEKRIGKVKEFIEVVDVSSPATVLRYTNNWKGSFEGWIMTPKNAFELFNSALPGLENFYMIGQWMSPGGGLPAGLLTGRNIAQLICARDKKKFVTQQF